MTRKLLTAALCTGLMAFTALAEDNKPDAPPAEKKAEDGQKGKGKGKFGKGGGVEALFKKLDANDDGKIDRDEFKKFGEGKGGEPKGGKGKGDRAAKLFDKLDANGDNVLSLDEFKKLSEMRGPKKEKTEK